MDQAKIPVRKREDQTGSMSESRGHRSERPPLQITKNSKCRIVFEANPGVCVRASVREIFRGFVFFYQDIAQDLLLASCLDGSFGKLCCALVFEYPGAVLIDKLAVLDEQ
jgi:hypothetical protein